MCPSCSFQIQPEWYFCPNCGKQLKEAPITISIPKQLLIYFVSFFLAPLGLSWGLKYVKYKDRKVKMVGIISIILTVLSIILLIGTFQYFMQQYAQTLNTLSNPQLGL